MKWPLWCYLGLILSASLLLKAQGGIGGKSGVGGKGGIGGGSTISGSAPTIVSTNAAHTNGSSTSASMGTASIGDIVHYGVDADSATAVLTVTLSGSCAASGGVVVDKSGPAYNSNFMQAGHFIITAGGACTVNFAWTVASDGWLGAARISGATVLDQVAAFTNQNVLSGTNAWTSNSVTTSSASACIGYAIETNFSGGTLTAGTLNGTAWAMGTNSPIASPGPFGEETVVQGTAGAITASFSDTASAFPYVGISCYH